MHSRPLSIACHRQSHHILNSYRPTMKDLAAFVALVASSIASIAPCSALSLGYAGGSDGYPNRRDVIKDAAIASSAGLTSYVLSPNGLALPASAASTAPSVPTVKLGGSSLEVSRTIQGYWQLAGKHGDYKEEDALENMRAHFEAGITTLDTADIYGESERIMGRFVKTEKASIPCNYRRWIGGQFKMAWRIGARKTM